MDFIKFLNFVELIFLTFFLCVDNSIIISLITKDLDEKKKNKSIVLASILSTILRLVLSLVLYFLLYEDIKFIFLIGGLFITLTGVMSLKEGEKKVKNLSDTFGLFKIVAYIFFVDFFLSFDNSLIISEDIHLVFDSWIVSVVVISLVSLLSFPIIIFGSKFLGYIVEKNKWINYILIFLLILIGINMFFEDPLLSGFVNSIEWYWLFLIKLSICIVIILLRFLYLRYIKSGKIKIIWKK